MAKLKKVFVSGCFDMLHSGHVCFLSEAAKLGEVHVALGSDRTVRELKGRLPVNSQEERRYMLQALKCVKSCRVNLGSGILDFLAELRDVDPDIFLVNEEGNTPAKEKLCRDLGIEYRVLKRIPHGNLPARSTTSLRRECRIPYRLDLAGGWLDQAFVSRHAAGPVLTVSVEPTLEFNERSGMASSTRRRAVELWQTDLPGGDREKTARLLFSYENPPGTKQFSGSQDSIGIVYPGLNRLDYQGEYWPAAITSELKEDVLCWLEKHIYLVTLGPRKANFNVRKVTRITPGRVRALAVAADAGWKAILSKDAREFGRQMRASFEAQVSLFPNMIDRQVRSAIRKYSGKSLGWKLSGAGGGGYLIMISEQAIPEAIQIKIRRELF
jgi:cytidyltransferase-like protein